MKAIRILLSLFVCALTVTLCASAEENTRSLSEGDFSAFSDLRGIFITDIPAGYTMRQGPHTLRAGDAVPEAQLSSLTLTSEQNEPSRCTLTVLPVYDAFVGSETELVFSIGGKKNSAPTANSGTLETYKNLARVGKVTASDPEDDPLTFEVDTAPKHGTVTFDENGRYTYTPQKNKVGSDVFTYTVTDTAGNTSEPASVRIKILNPSDKTAYEDMKNDENEFEALYLKNRGVFTGEQVGSIRNFHPDATVTNGEFLTMTMTLFGFEPDSSDLSGYLSAAARDGLLSAVCAGSNTFPASEPVTGDTAALILQAALHITGTVPVFESGSVAASAVSALQEAGLPAVAADIALTRRDAAVLLYQAAVYEASAQLRRYA